MLSIIEDLPVHVLGIRASGEVTKTDIATVLLPALDHLAERTGQLNYLLVLDTDPGDAGQGTQIDAGQRRHIGKNGP